MTSFQLPSAIDEDTGANHSVQDYSLLTSGVPFSLQTQGSASQDPGLWLRLTGGLDRETEGSYRLLLVARDGGQPVRSGTLTVNVQVRGRGHRGLVGLRETGREGERERERGRETEREMQVKAGPG